ncbi:MAG: hypothetical protein KKH32_05785 [Bacteroidetes bacterium]|nr:hypothetical protein [Bacteroidota bacterium]
MKELSVDSKTLDKVKNKIGIEPAAAVGVTVFDVLYNTSKMDPFVLKGIDHLHHGQNFESLAELSDFVKEKLIKSEEGTRVWREMIHKYKGYTGEEYVFDKWDQKGIEYVKPESGTNPQYDAIIDGQKIDIAVTDHPSEIYKKLRESDDVTIYTNREMARNFEDNPRVIIDDDLSVQDMFQRTDESYTGIDDLGDFIDGIPLVTAVISGVKNARGVIKGNKNIGTAIEHTVTDVVGVGVGGWAGANIGLSIGLALALVTGGISVVLGPIIGSIGGVLGGGGLAKWFKERHLKKAKESLESIAGEYKRTFLEKYSYIVQKVEHTFLRNKNRANYAKKDSQKWFGRMFFPKILAKFYAMSSRKFSKELKQSKRFYEELKSRVNLYGDYKGGMIVYSYGTSILAGDPKLINLYNTFTKLNGLKMKLKNCLNSVLSLHKIHEEEVAKGLRDKEGKKKTKASTTDETQGGLFGG